MMHLVALNGILLSYGNDYVIDTRTGSLSFMIAPSMGDQITVTSKTGTVTHMQNLTGNGTTYRFSIDNTFTQHVEISELVEDAYKNKHHPAVLDALEKLKVVVALVNNNDNTIRQW